MGAASESSQKIISLPIGSISVPTRSLKSKKSMAIPEGMVKACTKREQFSIAEFLGDEQPAPFALWFQHYHNDLAVAKLPISEPVPMLEEERLKVCQLKIFYLVMCHSQGRSGSEQRIHGGIWYHQLPDVIALIRDACMEGQVVIVEANKCHEDNVIAVKNGTEASLLNGWESFHFNKIHNRLTSPKAKPSKRRIIVKLYGYATSGFG
jgi:hypothetical protein